MFSLPITEPSLSFTNVKIITIPRTSFITDFGPLRAIKVVLVSLVKCLTFRGHFLCFLIKTGIDL